MRRSTFPAVETVGNACNSSPAFQEPAMNLSRRDAVKAAVAAAFTDRLAHAREPAPTRSAGSAMMEAALRLLDGVKSADRAKIAFPADDPERFNWHFVPLNDAVKKSSTRKGVSFEELGDKGRGSAMDLLKEVASLDGVRWCREVMEREDILAEFEPRNAWFRKTGWYFVTVFGKPAATGRWGWRLDGHHLSVNVTLVDGEIVSATPFFIGVNPVTVMHGPRKGRRDIIAPAEHLARDLFRSLSPDQRRVALQPKHLPEVAGRTDVAPTNLPLGLSAAEMTSSQQKILLALVGHYTGRMAPSLAAAETARMTSAGVDRLSFAYTGEADPGKRHTYAVQGPTLFIHYMNEQTDPHRNPANHIHSIYRAIGRDFGGSKRA
jgi:hypothetical protein